MLIDFLSSKIDYKSTILALLENCNSLKDFSKLRKVASSSLSRLVAHFRWLMKGKFDTYVLWPLATKFQNWIVDRSTARDFTVRWFLAKKLAFYDPPSLKFHDQTDILKLYFGVFIFYSFFSVVSTL